MRVRRRPRSPVSARRRPVLGDYPCPGGASSWKFSGRRRVLPLWETFLLQMNDFDRFLERGLRSMLDPVVVTPPPVRVVRANRAVQPVLTVPAPAGAPDATSAVEPVALTLPVSAAPQL